MNDEIFIEIGKAAYKILTDRGLVPELQIRDEAIREEYNDLRRSGVKGSEAREQLADKYFLGMKAIEKILYGKK